jgi:hypothetical protein
MKAIPPLCVIAALLLAACATVGPTAPQLSQVLAEAHGGSPPEVKRLSCQTFEEEPTEFLCHWRQRDASGVWRRWATYLALDSRGYQLIDEVYPADSNP